MFNLPKYPKVTGLSHKFISYRSKDFKIIILFLQVFNINFFRYVTY